MRYMIQHPTSKRYWSEVVCDWVAVDKATAFQAHAGEPVVKRIRRQGWRNAVLVPVPKAQDVRMRFVPHSASKEVIPDAPEGEWLAIIHGHKCRKAITTNGDPRVSVAFLLARASNPAHVQYEGTVLFQSMVFYDETDTEKRRAANMSVAWARSLCVAASIDFEDFYPHEIADLDDLDPMIAMLDGKKVRVRTVQRPFTTGVGETAIHVDVVCLPPLRQPSCAVDGDAFMRGRLKEATLLRALLEPGHSIDEIMRLIVEYREESGE